METPEHTATTSSGEPDLPDLPPGNHPLEIAARKGIGPLSPLGGNLWHGETRPCVSCGQLVRRELHECDECGQDLSPEMIEKMRTHAGPWYVLEHVRPFPGVSLDRVVRQVRRGLITETSIVRGPSTEYQWRFAVETPGLCRYFGKCWHCLQPVAPADTHCRACLSSVSFEKPRVDSAVVGGTGSTIATPGTGNDNAKAFSSYALTPPPLSSTMATRVDEVSIPSDELRKLSAAVGRAELPSHEPVWDDPPRIGGLRTTWIAAGMMVIVVVVLVLVTHARSRPPLPADQATPGLIAPPP